MPLKSKLHIAVVGLNFGADFVPLYAEHPDVETVTVCDANPAMLSRADWFSIPQQNRTANFQDVLDNPDIDAVHLLTSVPMHVEHTLAAFKAGKHVACAVPMAQTIDDLNRVL